MCLSHVTSSNRNGREHSVIHSACRNVVWKLKIKLQLYPLHADDPQSVRKVNLQRVHGRLVWLNEKMDGKAMRKLIKKFSNDIHCFRCVVFRIIQAFFFLRDVKFKCIQFQFASHSIAPFLKAQENEIFLSMKVKKGNKILRREKNSRKVLFMCFAGNKFCLMLLQA